MMLKFMPWYYDEDVFLLFSALAKYKNNEKLQEKKIKILCHQGRFEEAYDLAKNWKEAEPQVCIGPGS